MRTRHHTASVDAPWPPDICERCGADAGGIDEHGVTVCDECAGRDLGADEARREDVGLMLRAAIAGARATGLPDEYIRQAIAEELRGPFVTRIEEDVPLLPVQDRSDAEGE